MPIFEYECRECGRQFEAFVTAERQPSCPACQDVVLGGRLVTTKSYLGPNEDRILTDYRIIPEQLIVGALPLTTAKTPRRAQPLTLTVYGGDLTLEGVLLRARDPNRDEIVEGRSYLLFSAHSRRAVPGSYEIHHGGIFEVSDDTVRPLLKQGDKSIQGYDW